VFLNVLQNQWLMLALLGGVAMVLIIALAYAAIWRPRHAGDKALPADAAPKKGALPWLLVLVYVTLLVWGVIYTLRMVAQPPNW
jgi:hypothetical protein